MPTLRKIKRAAIQRSSRNLLQHILFCQTTPDLIITRILKRCKLLIKSLKFIANELMRLFNFDTCCQVNIFKLKTTGKIIREKREKKGLLLRHVSAILDIDTAILSKIERGERKPTREQIIKLADILELDKETLLIQYLSEKILYAIQDEDLGIKALKVAEKSIRYGLNKNK